MGRRATRSEYPLRERVAAKRRGEGSFRRKFGENGFENAIRISQDIVTPVAQHAITGIRELSIMLGISHVVRVLAAIDFDNDLLFITNEVGDEFPIGT